MLTKYLSVFFISMVPLIELRGAIPVGVAMGLPLWQVYIIAIIGNMIPVPIIFFFARKVLEWGAGKPVIGKFFTFCLEKGHKGGEKLKAKAGRGLPWALLLFVGIPLPGTGAWTGALVADVLDIRMRTALPAIAVGVVIAGCITTAVTCGVAGLMWWAAQRILLGVIAIKRNLLPGTGGDSFFAGGKGLARDRSGDGWGVSGDG